MCAKSLRILFVFALLFSAGGCSDEEEEPDPAQKWGKEVQAVREKIFHDGTVTRALTAYRMNIALNPTTEQGLKALFSRPSGLADPSWWKGPYLEDEGELIDFWGNELKYACPGKTFPDNPKKYDLWSMGPDGVDGTEDDILNHNVK